MIYAILEQIHSSNGGAAMVLGYTFDRQKAIDELAKRAAKVAEDYAILDLKLFSTSPEHVTFAAPHKTHNITVEFTIVEVQEFLET